MARRFGVARRYSAAFAFALLLSVVPIAGTGAQSQPSDAELKKRQEQLEQQQKDLEAQLAEERRIRDEAQAELLAKIGDVDLAQADVNEILEAFDQLKLLVNEQRADLDRAELALAAAEASVEAAIGRVTSLDAQHGELGQRVIDLIVQTYIGHDASVEGSYGLVRTGDIYDAARLRVLIGAALGDLNATADQLRALTIDAELAVREFQRAEELRDIRRTESERALEDLLDVVEQEATVLAQLEHELENLLYEQQALQEWNDAAAADVAETADRVTSAISEQRRIESELKRRKAEEERRRREAEERRRRELEGTVGQPTSNNIPASDLAWVGGIRVHVSIANKVQDLLEHAARDGIRLTGGGYRSAARQIAVRRANCGTSQWAIYQKPAYQCRPPTARPGRSMHERGLAIDFQHNGRGISSRNSTAFRWLKANAATYGLHNLPSEPWHWSTNGN
ncbi:D-alanyl-D-alanine carboxypeptidase family protein [Candidatus Poriferisodalis sp.]|uniref:D-alanyl-D-alanine carboxypeptidase family protein n=1 Tax=Candidatus Poriferisodalis sp. TaxID=3101277 RepID=UPI003B524D14